MQSKCRPKALQQRTRQNSSEATSPALELISTCVRSSCAKSPSVRYSATVDSGPVGIAEKMNVVDVVDSIAIVGIRMPGAGLDSIR